MKLSCVILGFNDYPLIARTFDVLEEELADIQHEIIFVDNGSTDGTHDWLDHLIHSKDFSKYSLVNFTRIDLPNNMGQGYGMNRGLEKAKGDYIFFIDGDKLPLRETVIGLLDYIEKRPDISYLGINSWVSQDETEHPQWIGFENVPAGALGLGNYAYAYAIIRREVIDSGVRFADQGIFAVPGCNYADLEFAYQMYSKGFKGYLFSHPWYYHEHKNRELGISSEEQERLTLERKRWLSIRWNKVDFSCVHYHDQPPERHIRRVAMIYKSSPNVLGLGGWLERGVQKVCETQHFIPGAEVGGFDDYFYFDDSPNDYMEPRYRPATYYATDFVVPPLWSSHLPDIYLQRMRNFDTVFVSNTPALEYCAENGIEARMLGFAADVELHRPHNVPRDLDWVAVWHNCGDRVAACEAAYKRFPGGQVLWAGDELYAEYISRGKCALNWLRANAVNCRVFEVMACGTPLITTRHDDMSYYGFVENKHYLGYSSIDEMVDQIAWIQEHEAEAMKMAAEARALVLSRHTYDHLALELFA